VNRISAHSPTTSHALDRVRRAWPWAAGEHGPLPAILVALTVVTGLVDAVSYLALGHVFVANMTGNVVFLGFALAGARASLRPPRSPRSARGRPALSRSSFRGGSGAAT
jgi:Protein of unknown function (DUF1275)